MNVWNGERNSWGDLGTERGGPHVRTGCKLVMGGKIAAALSTLHEAYRYACDTASDRWDFAVPAQVLGQLGLTETDCRWLVRKELVDHAREVTRVGDDGRDFRPSGDLTFCARSCFVLTDSGVAEAIRTEADSRIQNADPGDVACTTVTAAWPERRIRWDAVSRYLTVDDRLVKWFRSPAPNQERILAAFQEEAWPPRVDDPLPQHKEQDPKRRLSDTIKCLNRTPDRDRRDRADRATHQPFKVPAGACRGLGGAPRDHRGNDRGLGIDQRQFRRRRCRPFSGPVRRPLADVWHVFGRWRLGLVRLAMEPSALARRVALRRRRGDDVLQPHVARARGTSGLPALTRLLAPVRCADGPGPPRGSTRSATRGWGHRR